jgi:hypothetical protein
MRRDDRGCVVPLHRELKVGTLRGILKQAGVALTGSDTSCNALFGSLQRIAAEQLGLNPVQAYLLPWMIPAK